MWRPSFNLTAMVLLNIALVGVALAQSGNANETEASVDPTGSWKWDRPAPDGNTMAFSLKLNWDDEKQQLTGNYTSFGQTAEIKEAKLDQDAVSFRVEREFNGNEFTVNFDGKVAEDDIRGTSTVNFGDAPREFEWHAKRFVDKADVLGVWELEIETPTGDVVEPRLTITEVEGKLHGTYVSVFGEREAKNVRIDEEKNELSWEISGDRDDFVFKAVYRGQPRGNTIDGQTEFDFGGNTGTMEFTGKRQPPKDE